MTKRYTNKEQRCCFSLFVVFVFVFFVFFFFFFDEFLSSFASLSSSSSSTALSSSRASLFLRIANNGLRFCFAAPKGPMYYTNNNEYNDKKHLLLLLLLLLLKLNSSLSLSLSLSLSECPSAETNIDTIMEERKRCPFFHFFAHERKKTNNETKRPKKWTHHTI